MTSKYRSGFTLLELLLFIVLAGITTALLATFLVRITRFSTANSVANSVDQGGTQMMSSIEFYLKDTEEILSPEIGTEGSELLVRTSANEFIQISEINNQLIYTNTTTDESFVMNPDDTMVEGVTFQPIIGLNPDKLGEPVPANLAVNLSLAYVAANVSTDSFEYDYSKTYSKSIDFPQNLKQLTITEGLELWLRPDKDLFVNPADDEVVSWTDQIQNAIFTAPSGTNPTSDIGLGGLPTVSFNGTNALLRAEDLTGLPQGDSQRTIFVVSTPEDFSTSSDNLITEYGSVTASPDTARFGIATRLDTIDTFGLQYSAGITTMSELNLPFDQPNILSASYDANQSTLYYNNTLIASESGLSLNTTGDDITIGAGINNSDYYEGSVSEILIFSRVLPASEREAVYQYLNRRYNLQSISN